MDLGAGAAAAPPTRLQLRKPPPVLDQLEACVGQADRRVSMLTKRHGAAIPNRLVDVGLKLQRSGGGLERQRYLLCGRGAREACLRPTVRARGVQARRAARRCVLLHQEGPETVQSAQPSTPHRDVDTSAGVELPADEVDNRFDCCDDVCGQRPRSQRFNQESAQRSRNARRTWSSRGLTK
jgi:hypothetical protein